ncbi:MAG TPA: hypothetical protein VNK04_12750 [Gemmataceae bacterium]|nr:hypothetical protein [Gemmataceae bacterium]
MATVRDRAATPAPPTKYDALVEAQLARARRRIRALDLIVAILGFLAATLAYALVMVLCDRSLGLAPSTRQLAFVAYLAGAALYLGVLVVRPLLHRINPYYAARQIEQTIPGAKNSVVNWLDLHQQPLPPAIQGAISHRAARDLAQADLDRAVSGRRAGWMGGLTAALFITAFVVMVTVGPGPFFSFLERTFLPFSSSGGIRTRTQITLLYPEGGNTTVPVGRSVLFRVYVEGRVPHPKRSDALRLLYRYRLSDSYEAMPLEQETDREWGVSFPSNQVHSGFWYKIAGGDAETPEYRVEVRSPPLATPYEATYHYRPYLHWPDETHADPNLKAMRGTEVTLLARANRTVKEGRLELVGAKKAVPAELVEKDPHVLRFRLVLDQDDQYRIFFTSTEGESTVEPTAYTITVIPDYPPQVKITEPAEDEITKPANALLEVEGSASDDIGVKGLTLRLQVADGPVLRPKVYREGKSFQLSDGGYPKILDYKDSVDLAKVKDAEGKDFALRPGMVLEYWLEAADDCDYPAPHVAQSKPRKRVIIGEPEKDPQKQEQARRQAAEEQKQHEAKQDEKLRQEDEQRQKEAKAGNQPNQAQDPQAPPPDRKDPEQEKQDRDIEEQARRIKEELERKEKERQKDRREGEAKGDERQEPKGGAKDEGQSPEQEEKKGECKNQGASAPNDPKQRPAESKKGDAGQEQAGSEKSAGKPENQSGQGEKSAAKEQPGSSAEVGQGKGEASQKPERAEARDAGRQDPKEPPAQTKPEGAAKPGQQSQKTQAKGPGNEGAGADRRPPGDAKGEPQPTAKSDGKGPGRESASAKEPQGKPKDPGKSPPNEKTARGQSKSAPPEKGDGSDVARAENKGAEQRSDGQPQAGARSQQARDAKKEDVDRLAKDLQSGDAQKQQDAADKLDQISRNAKDQQARNAARQALEKADKLPGKEAKPEDVAQQAKDLQSGDPQKREQAAEKLDQMARNARDKKVRDAARQALEKAERRPGENATHDDVAQQSRDLQSGDPQKREQAAEKLDQMARNAKDESVREAARQELEKSGQKPGQDAKPQDVARQEKELQQGDEKKWRDALDKLQQFLRNAKDEKVREAARQALERAAKQKQDEQSPGVARQPPSRPENLEAGGPKQGPPQGKEAEAGTPRAANPAQSTADRGQPKDADPDAKKGGDQPNAPDKVPVMARERGQGGGEESSFGIPGTGDARPDQQMVQPEEPTGGPADPRHRERGGVLQLEDLKKIDKEIRDKLGWSEEQLKKFQQAYADLLKRRQAEAKTAGEDQPLRPQQGGSLRNIQAQRVQPTQGSPVDARYLGRGQPPPGYQDADREFRRRLSELDLPPEKK